MSNVIAIASLVSEIGLVTEREMRKHARTHARIHTHTHTQTHTHTRAGLSG